MPEFSMNKEVSFFLMAIVCPFTLDALTSEKKREKLFWKCIQVLLKFEKENYCMEEDA